MIKRQLILSLLFFAICCVTKETDHALLIGQGKLNFLDTIKLDQDIVPISDFYKAQLMNDSIIGFLNVASNNLYCYTLHGEFLLDLSKDYFPVNILPKMSIAGFDIFNETLHVSYWGNNCIYKFSLEGSYDGKVCLKYKPNYRLDDWMHIITKDSIIIESEYSSWHSLKDKFSESPYVSVFNLETGTHYLDMGSYPDFFSVGNLALQNHVLIAQHHGQVYTLNPVGLPTLQKWSNSQLVYEWHIPLEKHDEQVSYFKSDPWSGDLMDQIIELGSDENNPGIFYGLYRYFENNLRNEGENTYGLRFFKLNLKTNSFFEQDMEESYADIGSLVMIPTVKNDTIRFLKKEQEEVYLLTATTLN